MTQWLQQFMAAAGPWAYVMVGLMACAETAALIGLLVPGEVTLLIGGFLVFTGQANLLIMMVAAGVGAVIGDSISYWIGWRLGSRVRDSRLGRRVGEDRWDRAQAFLRRRGGWAVFFGRWVGLLRALMPMLAGMGRLPYLRFLVYDVPGGLMWGAGTVAMGYLAGGSYLLVKQVAGRAGLLVVICLTLLIGAVLGARWVARNPDRVRRLAVRGAAWPPIAVPGRAVIRIVRRLRPASGVALSLAVLLAVSLLFAAVSEAVVRREGIAAFDLPLLRWVAEHREPQVTTMIAVTASTVPWAATAVAVIVAAWQAGPARAARPLVLVVVGIGGVTLLDIAVKLIVHRSRPPVQWWAIREAGYSFPSLHTATTVVAAALTAYLLGRRDSWPRKVALWQAALVVAAGEGSARLYLGVHWTSDIIASWALGAAWCTALLLVDTLTAPNHAPRSPAG
ncbi:hypothetical protein Pth03_81540 [Planotetraspora thailandica]|uniref:Phosphatidic acid phosphatase type 2/haloperoxidase domain-containing protein n=1 Tax=Planotetraspora thailandica TaxID=487172 RepID=A0A8J3Y2L0_9ACTN|nr:VTT domain-containing protein [Planotetraspora thailandica]GII59765.1 hypothetical protein Pth03_81540 [Planotetraspora thailandica]